MARWDLSKLPEGRKPLPDEWFAERAQMQDRIKEMEKQLRWVLYERDATFKSMLNRAETAEAKLAKAVRVMAQVNEALENWNKNQDMETFRDLGAALVSNHETLAELTGGNDE